MKIKSRNESPFKKRAVTEDAEEPRSSKGGGWMMTGADQQKEALSRQRLLSDAKRPPEMWVKEGEDKLVRFVNEGPIACLYVYSVRIDGRWKSITCPEEGQIDLFKSELGLRPSFKAIYEVVDIHGYVDKEQKKHKNVRRFYVGSSRVYEALEKLREKKGPLNRYNVEISRTGTGTQTSYTFLPDSPTPMTSEMKAGEALAPKFASYYAPPTAAEQRVLVRAIASAPQADE